MTAIAKHTGGNVGGIALVEFAFPYEISDFDILPGYIARVSFDPPEDWKILYATPRSFSGNGTSELIDPGSQYNYEFKFRCPKDRQDLIGAFHMFVTYGVILRVTDANSVRRIYGISGNPLTAKSKLLLPGQVQGYNGYEIALSVSMPDPAYLDPVQ